MNQKQKTRINLTKKKLQKIKVRLKQIQERNELNEFVIHDNWLLQMKAGYNNYQQFHEIDSISNIFNIV